MAELSSAAASFPSPSIRREFVKLYPAHTHTMDLRVSDPTLVVSGVFSTSIGSLPKNVTIEGMTLRQWNWSLGLQKGKKKFSFIAFISE